MVGALEQSVSTLSQSSRQGAQEMARAYAENRTNFDTSSITQQLSNIQASSEAQTSAVVGAVTSLAGAIGKGVEILLNKEGPRFEFPDMPAHPGHFRVRLEVRPSACSS